MNIDALLAIRNTRRIGSTSNHDLALKNLEISKYIAKHYEGFNVLRKHLVHPSDNPQINHISTDTKLCIQLLLDMGWIKQISPKQWHPVILKDSQEFSYLKGNWLEEYLYCAHIHAGVDEAYCGQQIEWRVGNVIGKNEIDVIARRGETISFTSCKSQNPFPGNGTSTQLTKFLSEVDYWDTHFANNTGKLLLAVTTDLIDEINANTHRYPLVVARASILQVDLIGLEDLIWESLVGKIGEHWDVL